MEMLSLNKAFKNPSKNYVPLFLNKISKLCKYLQHEIWFTIWFTVQNQLQTIQGKEKQEQEKKRKKRRKTKVYKLALMNDIFSFLNLNFFKIVNI